MNFSWFLFFVFCLFLFSYALNWYFIQCFPFVFMWRMKTFCSNFLSVWFVVVGIISFVVSYAMRTSHNIFYSFFNSTHTLNTITTHPKQKQKQKIQRLCYRLFLHSSVFDGCMNHTKKTLCNRIYNIFFFFSFSFIFIFRYVRYIRIRCVLWSK